MDTFEEIDKDRKVTPEEVKKFEEEMQLFVESLKPSFLEVLNFMITGRDSHIWPQNPKR